MTLVLDLTIEVAGCPTTCLHCWARGRSYAAMPIAQIARVLDLAQRFCETHAYGWTAYPMHEVADHPQAAQVFQLFHAYLPQESLFEPLATSGVPLATRTDWFPLLESAKATGTTTVWVAFHGVGAIHDQIVNRPGAFQETCVAADRIHQAGMRCGCNVFVTKPLVGQINHLVAILRDLAMDEALWSVPRYHPVRRVRHQEAVRPTIDDLLPVAPRLAAITAFDRAPWDRLEEHTEAAYYDRAIRATDDAQPWAYLRDPQRIAVVCRPNLDLHSGMAGAYGAHHGNLLTDDPMHVFARAMAHGRADTVGLYFTTSEFPPLPMLAASSGDPHGRRIYWSAPEVRECWLDRALAPYRKY